MAELLLDMAFVALGRAGEAGAQRMLAEFQPPLGLWKIAA
jgi:hypothetical protein